MKDIHDSLLEGEFALLHVLQGGIVGAGCGHARGRVGSRLRIRQRFDNDLKIRPEELLGDFPDGGEVVSVAQRRQIERVALVYADRQFVVPVGYNGTLLQTARQGGTFLRNARLQPAPGVAAG